MVTLYCVYHNSNQEMTELQKKKKRNLSVRVNLFRMKKYLFFTQLYQGIRLGKKEK